LLPQAQTRRYAVAGVVVLLLGRPLLLTGREIAVVEYLARDSDRLAQADVALAGDKIQQITAFAAFMVVPSASFFTGTTQPERTVVPPSELATRSTGRLAEKGARDFFCPMFKSSSDFRNITLRCSDHFRHRLCSGWRLSLAQLPITNPHLC